MWGWGDGGRKVSEGMCGKKRGWEGGADGDEG